MVMILDGGMGVELQRRGITEPTALWSAQALIDDPDGVVQTHLAYLAASAHMILPKT